MRRLAAVGALAGTVAAVAVGGTTAASVKPAYCSLPAGPSNPAWGFHVGAQITAPSRQAAIKRALLPLFAEDERKDERKPAKAG